MGAALLVSTAVAAGLAPVPAYAQDPVPAPASLTVPAPGSWNPGGADFRWSETSRVVYDASDDLAADAELLAGELGALKGRTVEAADGIDGARPGDIVLDVAENADLGAEGYTLTANGTAAVSGNTRDGAFWGGRTVLQALQTGDAIGGGSTTDVPAYPERGVMLCACTGGGQESVDWIVRLIKDMASLKLNQLTIEAKVKLDSVPESGAWPYYTKSQMEAISAAAAEYHVSVSPLINSPGHMDVWLKERPELQLQLDGEPLDPIRLDITRPEALDFVKNLIDEYLEVFPNAKIWHAGADEYMINYSYEQFPHIEE
ncbi:hypothetical protein AFB00_07390 [Pseudonocardia sp. HH130630-07]|nr:glycoside hydrolase family 20 zincin-like fold domain-containing protein [Pseudonocardia sp. HH130630-07]ANY06150.1 hypothetical protein AFB00_07390 [Pseudonocardia sp. HH130630-07]